MFRSKLTFYRVTLYYMMYEQCSLCSTLVDSSSAADSLRADSSDSSQEPPVLQYFGLTNKKWSVKRVFLKNNEELAKSDTPDCRLTI